MQNIVIIKDDGIKVEYKDNKVEKIVEKDYNEPIETPVIKEKKPDLNEINSMIKAKKEELKDLKNIRKKYDSKKYIKNFQEKNKDKIVEKHICDICYGSYTYFNKSKHIQSKKHNLVLQIMKNKNE
jgi:hypothetical protein